MSHEPGRWEWPTDGLRRASRHYPQQPQATLSVYLDISPPHIRGQAYLLSFRDRCRALRASLSAEDEDAFEVARGHAEHYLVDQFERRSPGLALFAAGGSEDIMVVPLPAAPSDHVVWSKRPSIAPLETMLDEHERVAVVLFDASEHACSRSFWAPSRQSSTLPTACRANRRPAAGSGSSRPALPATAKTTCVGTPSEPSKLMVLLRNYSFDRLLPAGPDEALTVLKRELPRPLSARLAGTMVAAGGW